MQFALLIYESPEAFAKRSNEERDAYTGAWRAYYQALVDAGVYVGGNPLEVPETGTTVRRKEGKRRVQDGVTGVIGTNMCCSAYLLHYCGNPALHGCVFHGKAATDSRESCH